MKPEDRLDARIASCPTLPEDLKEEILAALFWYRQVLYNARQDNLNLRNKAYLDSWDKYPDRMGGSFSDHEIAEASAWR